ncbi:MAG: hypothetical protein JKY55_05570 [Aliivibrio sp.]|uniref:glycosyltransferase family protein n=1 Tax=Aliivibrio sp. TaxID=1872443 RepID=UPI001A57F2A0|nr:hypothetical protein [Aliivibrio sp.]
MLLLRDILDSPHITKDVWLRHNYFSLIDKYYDEVIVVGQQSVFDTTAEYDFPSSIKSKTYFCGYLKRTYDDNRDEIRHQQIQVGQKMVVVAAGGGNDGREILSTYINGIKNSAWKDKIRSVIFYGPEMDEHDYVGLMESVRGVNNITLMEFTSDFMSYLSAADLVVTMGGYNTVCEIISLHKAAIIVPRATPVAEQLIRAECFSRLEILEYIHPCNLNSVILMEKVHRQLFLDVPSKKKNQINFSGMEALECKLLFQPTRNGCEQTLRESRI